MSAEFDVRLKDDVSGPAKKAASSLNKLKSAMTGAQSAANKWNRGVQNLYARNNAEMVAGFKRQQKAASQLGKTQESSFFSQALAADLLSRALRAVGRAALDVGVALGSAVADSVQFGESIKFSLTRFLGSAKDAEKAIADVMKVSNELGTSFKDNASNFKNFISAGFSKAEAMNLVRFKADIIALGDGSARTGQRIEEAFVQIEKAMATGRIEADGFNSILANLPVTKMQVMQKLAKKTGKSFDELMKTDITKLPVKELIQSFQEAMLEATGAKGLGEAAIKKQMSTLSGMWAAIKARAGNAIDAIGIKLGPQLFKVAEPYIKKLSAWLSSPEFAKGVEKVATAIASFVKTSLPKAIAGVKGFAAGFKALSGPLDKMDKVLGKLGLGDVDPNTFRLIGEAAAASLVPLRLLGAAIQFLVGPIAAASSAFDRIGPAIMGALAGVPAALATAAAQAGASARQIGVAIINGIVSGIVPGPIVSKVVGVAQAAITAAKGTLGVASPSKVFEEIGSFVGQGMTLGIEAEQPRVSAAAAGLIRPILPSMMPANMTSVNVGAPTASITVNAAQNPEATAAAIRKMMVEELADVFEQVSVQVGAA